jgi:hypothetical protein
MTRAVLVATAALCVAGCAVPPDRLPTLPDGYAWHAEPSRSLALQFAGQDVWRLHFGTDRTKPCFHPLALPGGPALTVDAPADHRWHHGLWFSWKYLDGVNHWEHAAGSRQPAGQTTTQLDRLTLHGDGSAEVALQLATGQAGQPPTLREQRHLRVLAPAADGSYAIDWQSTFTATTACTLDRTPLPHEPGGKAFGGYAGLSLRLRQLEARDALTTAGAVAWNDADRFRSDADAFEYRGALAGQDVAIAILAHPQNLRSPSPWYAIRSAAMTFVTPAVLCHGKLELAAGATFTLRYRIVVHPGRWSPDQLAAAHAAYVLANP